MNGRKGSVLLFTGGELHPLAVHQEPSNPEIKLVKLAAKYILSLDGGLRQLFL